MLPLQSIADYLAPKDLAPGLARLIASQEIEYAVNASTVQSKVGKNCDFLARRPPDRGARPLRLAQV
jgi:hypothetical protein